MASSNFNLKRIVTLLSFFIFLISIQAIAQTPAGIDPNNLSTVKVDDLSDDQIKLILKNSGTSGISIEQGSAMAIQRGLPASEVEKLKLRIAKIQSSNNTVTSPSPSTNNLADQINNANLNKIKDSQLDIGAVRDNEIKQEIKPTLIYGQSFFRNGDIKIFDKSTDAKATSNYIIGVGDEIGISVFGSSFYNEVLKVDSRGAINPSQMGPIFVKGLTFDKSKSLIKSKMNQYFDLGNNKMEVTLAYSRNITVNIVGEVLKPGSYNLPALNTAFNALILAGGPSDIGTLRNIEIRRNGKTIKIIDVYAFLNNPNSNQEFYLEENDYIVVGSAKKIITIRGEIKRPFKYELLPSENIIELVKYAGGLNAEAYTERIQINRISAKELKIIDLNYDSLLKFKKNFELVNGDEIIIGASISEIKNKVSIRGAVNFPSDYTFVKGMKLTSLIEKSGGVKVDADLNNAYLIRTLEDRTKKYIKINLQIALANKNSTQNIILEPLDILSIYSLNDFIEPFAIQVFGAVKSAGSFDFVNGMTLGDALRNAGGLKIEAENLRIEVSRLNYFSNDYTDGQDIRVIVEKITLNPGMDYINDINAQFKLQPFDQIFVRTVPNFELQTTVILKGEVKYPGVYTIMSKDEKLSNLIKRAGGINRFAFPEAATFYRPTIEGGYIVMDLNKTLKSSNSKYNYTLKDGDVITIPTITDFVSIKGSAIEYTQVTGREQVNAPYVVGRRAKYYINEFGNGFTNDSWRKKTYVIQPNAKVNKTRNFVLFKIYPKVTKGSTIYVVKKEVKPEELKKQREPFNWNNFVEKTTMKVTGLATLFILLKQL